MQKLCTFEDVLCRTSERDHFDDIIADITALFGRKVLHIVDS